MRRALELGIVIPTLDEEAVLPLLLGDLQPLRRAGAEIVVVDGGSSDATAHVAAAHADHVIVSGRGRALQMNAGAHATRAERLLFLHADARVREPTVRLLQDAAVCSPGWGFFGVTLRGRSQLLPLVACGMNWRSRITGIATGDQGLLVSRALFDAVGGFPNQPLMEDIEMSMRLRAQQRPTVFAQTLELSGRRWDRDGALRTIVLMWSLRLRYFLGADPVRLHARYYG
jgi:rSAM/selenodomain-associated transferase 2